MQNEPQLTEELPKKLFGMVYGINVFDSLEAAADRATQNQLSLDTRIFELGKEYIVKTQKPIIEEKVAGKTV